MNDNRDCFISAARNIGIELTNDEILLFEHYERELLFWNRKMSLISLKNSRDLIIKHFIDSLTAFPFITARGGTLIDIGSGGGFPGIPLKILMKGLSVTLLDASRKKTSFLKHVIRSLGLSGINVINERTDNIMKKDTLRGTFDTVITRATFTVFDMLPPAAFFLSEGGTLIVMKGRTVEEKLLEEPSPLGLEYISRHSLTLPTTEDERNILIFRKLKS